MISLPILAYRISKNFGTQPKSYGFELITIAKKQTSRKSESTHNFPSGNI